MLKSSLQSAENIITDFHFKKKDYDFTGYTNDKLKDLLQNDLLIITHYPKLILTLLNNNIFCSWYSKSKLSLISIIVKTIEEYENLYNNCELIEINNILFWKIFTMIYFNYINSDTEYILKVNEEILNQDDLHEKNVTKKVDSSLNVQNNTRKKGMRNVWIS